LSCNMLLSTDKQQDVSFLLLSLALEIMLE
jgi:hypothetical protein